MARSTPVRLAFAERATNPLGEPAVGLEPTTGGLRNRCSATELRRLTCGQYHTAQACVNAAIPAGATGRNRHCDVVELQERLLAGLADV